MKAYAETSRVHHRLRRNCEAMARILNDPAFPAASRAIDKRMQAFTGREKQLMSMIGATLSSQVAFAIFREVVKRK